MQLQDSLQSLQRNVRRDVLQAPEALSDELNRLIVSFSAPMKKLVVAYPTWEKASLMSEIDSMHFSVELPATVRDVNAPSSEQLSTTSTSLQLLQHSIPLLSSLCSNSIDRCRRLQLAQEDADDATRGAKSKIPIFQHALTAFLGKFRTSADGISNYNRSLVSSNTDEDWSATHSMLRLLQVIGDLHMLIEDIDANLSKVMRRGQFLVFPKI